MDRKTYAVIGLGIFGSAVAKTLARAGMDVIAIDNNMLAVENVSDTVDNAVKADSTNIEQLREAGIQNCDVVILAMGSRLEESLITIIHLRELGVQKIVAKANNNNYKYLLERAGATRVIQPEKEMGVRLASYIMTPNIQDMVRLDEKYAFVELKTPSLWQGKSLRELDLRASYGVNVIGIRAEGESAMHMVIDAARPLSADETLMLIVDREQFDKLKLE